MMQDEFLLHGATASTGGCAVLVVLNGPIRLRDRRQRHASMRSATAIAPPP